MIAFLVPAVAFLATTFLAAIIGIFIKLHALVFTRKIVVGWVWLYSSFAPEETREGRRGEVLSHIHELIKDYQEEGYAPSEIAGRLLEKCALGMPDDMAWCAPFVPAKLADAFDQLSGIMRHWPIPSALIAAVVYLGLANYSFLINPSSFTFSEWLMRNGMIIPVIVLLSYQKHAIARKVLYTLIGVSMAVMAGFIVWMLVQNHLYEIAQIRLFLLAVVAALPMNVVIDKTWRSRFKGKWWLFELYWSPIIGAGMLGSWLITGSILPFFILWLGIGLSGFALILMWGAIGLAAFAACWAGIRGSAGGLRLVAAGLRRLH